jgi:hypothetical protein
MPRTEKGSVYVDAAYPRCVPLFLTDAGAADRPQEALYFLNNLYTNKK